MHKYEVCLSQENNSSSTWGFAWVGLFPFIAKPEQEPWLVGFVTLESGPIQFDSITNPTEFYILENYQKEQHENIWFTMLDFVLPMCFCNFELMGISSSIFSHFPFSVSSTIFLSSIKWVTLNIFFKQRLLNGALIFQGLIGS